MTRLAQPELPLLLPPGPPDTLSLDLPDGRVLIGSDLHAWPGVITTGMRSFIWAVKKLKPDVVVLNGDTIDGATLSRFPRIGWDYRPDLIQEVEAAQSFLATFAELHRKPVASWFEAITVNASKTPWRTSSKNSRGCRGPGSRSCFRIGRSCGLWNCRGPQSNIAGTGDRTPPVRTP